MLWAGGHWNIPMLIIELIQEMRDTTTRFHLLD